MPACLVPACLVAACLERRYHGRPGFLFSWYASAILQNAIDLIKAHQFSECGQQKIPPLLSPLEPDNAASGIKDKSPSLGFV